MYNCLVTSVLGRAPKDLPTVASPSHTEVVFEVTTQPADRVTVVFDLQSDESYLAGEGGLGEMEDCYCFCGSFPVDFIIPDQQPTSPLVKVKVGRDGSPVDNQTLGMIVKK